LRFYIENINFCEFLTKLFPCFFQLAKLSKPYFSLLPAIHNYEKHALQVPQIIVVSSMTKKIA